MPDPKRAARLRSKLVKYVEKHDIENIRQILHDMYEGDTPPIDNRNSLSWTPYVEIAALSTNINSPTSEELMLNMEYTKDAFGISEQDYGVIERIVKGSRNVPRENLQAYLDENLAEFNLSAIRL